MVDTPQTKMTGKKKAGVGAASLAALLVVASPFVGVWEGKKNYPYRDIVGVLTVCYGETRGVQQRYYSDTECRTMLDEAVGEFGADVAKRNPELVHYPYQWAAATSLAYNIGTGAYNRSTVARRFDQGRWRSACNNFMAWRYAGGKEIRGLVNRRKAEREMCLTDLPLIYDRT